jgi:hypothetical protein
MAVEIRAQNFRVIPSTFHTAQLHHYNDVIELGVDTSGGRLITRDLGPLYAVTTLTAYIQALSAGIWGVQ